MSVSASVQEYLTRKGVIYDLLNHTHSNSSLESARLAGIPAGQLLKGVLTHDDDNYLLCVIPANHHLTLARVNRAMQGNFELASEQRVGEFFNDCDLGAIPALGQAYGLHVIWDDSLADKDDLYIESGDHENLIHVSRGAFMELMGGLEHMDISAPED